MIDEEPEDEPDGKDEYLCISQISGISDDDLNQWFSVIKSQQLIIILDTCYSGGFIDGTQDLSAPGREIITSSKVTETSWNYWDQFRLDSVFTYHFINGCKGPADYNNDKKITVQEAFTYTQEKISDEGYPQHPQFDDRYNGDIVIIDLEDFENKNQIPSSGKISPKIPIIITKNNPIISINPVSLLIKTATPVHQTKLTPVKTIQPIKQQINSNISPINLNLPITINKINAIN